MRSLLLVVSLFLAQSLWAEPTAVASNLVKMVSLDDVQTTMDRLEILILDRGLELYGRINLADEARKHEIKVPDTQLISFGNPRIMGFMRNHDVNVALALPLKMLVHSAEDGNTWVQYQEPLSLRQQYRLDKCTAMEELSRLMAELAEAAANGP